MSRQKWISLLGLLGLGSAAVFAALRSLWWLPPDRLDLVPTTTSKESLQNGTTLKLLMWNIQYGASRNYHFFYDGGPDVHVSEAHVTETLDAIAAVIQTHQPDIVMLQEVDRGSRRTNHVDQLEELLRRLNYPDYVSTPYHKVPYLPHPSHDPLGRVEMHLTVFSRYRIDSATRYQLPLLDESALRQAFNLRRALLEVRLPTAQGDDLVLFNTHLSAFSMRDGTLERQIATLKNHMTKHEQREAPWLLGGDLNALAPGDDPSRLGEDAKFYADGESPVSGLFESFRHPVPKQAYASDPGPWRTYLPTGVARPDRTLDYIFHGSRLEVLSYSVLQDADIVTISDHLPILAEIQLP